MSLVAKEGITRSTVRFEREDGTLQGTENQSKSVLEGSE